MKKERIIDRERVITETEEFVSCNILECEVGTNGYHGGDTGHGCRTYFRLKDLSSTDIEVVTSEDEFGNKEVEIRLGGDCELSTFIEALEFAATTLRGQEYCYNEQGEKGCNQQQL